MTAFRTVKRGNLRLTGMDWLLAAVATWLVPGALGGLLVLPLFALDALGWVDGGGVGAGTPLGLVTTFGVLLFMAPLVTIFIVPLALLLGNLALRIGYGGWGTALCVAALAPAPFIASYAVAEPDPLLTLLVYWGIYAAPALVHAAVLWFTIRLRRPEAIAPRAA
ncbi:hypothetical protein [Jannaschia marina]|uniref:hypothetical protein n=1 Tax=Jannaschia marina TaxID=2741674 RepID=UPI0015CD8A5F|nr:hypothetical protein [Jannaschia marina]